MSSSFFLSFTNSLVASRYFFSSAVATSASEGTLQVGFLPFAACGAAAARAAPSGDEATEYAAAMESVGPDDAHAPSPNTHAANRIPLPFIICSPGNYQPPQGPPFPARPEVHLPILLRMSSRTWVMVSTSIRSCDSVMHLSEEMFVPIWRVRLQ